MISESDFEKVCMDGDIDTVNSVIKDMKDGKGPFKDSYLYLGLLGACHGGHLDIVKLIIEHKDVTGFLYAFIVACKRGHLNVINFLIEKGVHDWDSGLGGACEGGHLDIVNLMIDKGADKWNMGLYDACLGGHLDIIKLMIDKGARDWNYGLCGACSGGHLNVINFMIEKGANDWNRGLHGACKGGHLDVVNLMIEKGADSWDYGLKYACQGRHLNIVKLMIEKGADGLGRILCGIPDLIDSDIVKLIVESDISLGCYFEYPENEDLIIKLHGLGIPFDMFKDIEGFDDFIKKIEERRNIVRPVLSDHLIKDLVKIAAKYVID